MDEVSPPRVREIARQDEEEARRAKYWTIIDDAPVTLDMDSSRTGRYDREKAVDFLRELEFFSLIARLPGEETRRQSMSLAVEAEVDCRIRGTIERTLTRYSKRVRLNVTTFPSMRRPGRNPMSAQLVGISLATGGGEAYYIPVRHVILEAGSAVAAGAVVSLLKPVLLDVTINKMPHNAKFAMMALEQARLDGPRNSVRYHDCRSFTG